MTIQNFSIEYDAINSQNIFSTGDHINGRIVLEVSKKIQVQALIFRAQGRANVCWYDHFAEHTQVYTSKEKYYDEEHHILRATRRDGTDKIGPGRHVFPFSFKIPERHIPSTFESSIGKIVHKLKAELKQSMRLTKKAKTHITFVSAADMNIPGLLEPQHGCRDKTIRVFGSGTVAMDVHTERLGYWQGEALKITVEIQNQLSRVVKPKLIFYKKTSHFAQGERRMNTCDILKEKFDPVQSGCSKTVRMTITIPTELPPSILNCSIIRLEYRLKILLKIKCASNPEIKLPIVVLPEKSSHKAPSKKSKEYETLAQHTSGTASSLSQAPAGHTQSLVRYSPAAASASDDPPPYSAYALHPSYSHMYRHNSHL